MAKDKSQDTLPGACPQGVRNATRIDGLDDWMHTLAEALEKVRARPPVWATFLIAALTAVVASLGTLITALINGEGG